MSLIDLHRDPSPAQLRQFSLICLVFLPLVGWLWGASPVVLWALVSLGVVLTVLSFVFTPAVKAIFVGLMFATAPLGIVVGEVAMLFIYFGVFLPIGIAFRLMGRDALGLRANKAAVTYWRPKCEAKDAASYYRRY